MVSSFEEVGSDRLERGGDLKGDLGVVRVDVLLVVRAVRESGNDLQRL